MHTQTHRTRPPGRRRNIDLRADLVSMASINGQMGDRARYPEMVTILEHDFPRLPVDDVKISTQLYGGSMSTSRKEKE